MNCIKKMETESSPKIIKLPIIEDSRGTLTFLEEKSQIPFDIKQLCWIYDVTGEQFSKGQTFKKKQQIIIAISGSFDVVINDGTNEQRFHLNCPNSGLFIPENIWQIMDNFSTGTVVLVLSDTLDGEENSIRDFDTCKAWRI